MSAIARSSPPASSFEGTLQRWRDDRDDESQPGGQRGLDVDREPRTIEEARTMLAYNERILVESSSRQRHRRAERMIENLRPHLARLEAEAAASRPTPARTVRQDDEFEYEVVNDCSGPVTSWPEDIRGGSSLSGEARLRT